MNLIFSLIKEYKLYVVGRFLMFKPIPKEWSRGDKGDVILVPGFADNHYFLSYIGNELNKNGYRIHTVSNFNTTKYSIDRLASRLANYIKTNNLNDVILIGHSKGGLVSKYTADHYKSVSDNIKLIFTISTPYGGVFWSKFKWIPFTKEFSFENPTLQLINEDSDISDKIINIYSRIDNVVIPNKSLKYDYAKANIQTNFIGHTGILNDSEVLLQIKSHLSN